MSADEDRLAKLDEIVRLRVASEVAPIQADLLEIKHTQNNLRSGLAGLVPVLQRLQADQEKNRKDLRPLVQMQTYVMVGIVIVGFVHALPEDTRLMLFKLLGFQ